MAYTKRHTPWVDFPGTSTPILAADLDAMETGIYDAHVTADGAVAKSLVDAKGDLIVASAADTVGRLPVGSNNTALVADAAQTFGVKWVDLGTLVVPLSLVDAKGDVLVGTAADTVGRLAVGSDGHVLTADSTQSTGVKWAASSGAGYGTSLPGSPTDGQEYILVDSTSTPTYRWRFRYNSGSSSSYKWEFVGGTPKWVEVTTKETRNTSTYGDCATVGPSFTLPNAGDWEFGFGAVFGYPSNVSVLTGGKIGLGVNGTVSSGDEIFNQFGTIDTAAPGWVSRTKAALAASDVVKLMYGRQGGSGSVTAAFEKRIISVTPIRVS